jgi:hypothetical protein
MEKQNSSPTKRFRSDLINIRGKQQIIPNNNKQQRTTQLSYRNSNNYQREQQNQIILSSPIYENFNEDNKQINYDMDLNMNCFEEQLSDSQMAHCPVKVNFIIYIKFI